MTRVIDGQEMLDLLQQAVAERGDSYVYPVSAERHFEGCVYWFDPNDEFSSEEVYLLLDEAYNHQEQAACAVGLALEKLDHRLIEEILLEGMNTSTADAVLQCLSGEDYVFTEDARRVARVFQFHQDVGIPWGEALVMAKEDPKANATQ